MMAIEERDVSEWDQADAESGKLLADAGIGGSVGGGGRRPRGAAGKSGHTHVQAQNISMCGLLSLEFYRPYFDVDTNQVKARLLQALWPIRMNSLFLYHADVEGSGGGGSAPDLYGPVWISATLIFALSVVANARRSAGSADFDKVSTSMYSVFAYVAIGSLGLWGFFRAHGVPLSPAEALSVYGYSLTPFLAAAPLGLISSPFRLASMAGATTIAAIFVLRSGWPRLQEQTPERSTIVLLAAVAAYHFAWFVLLAVE